MRIDPIFALLLAVPLGLAGLAFAPITLSGPAEAPAPAPAIEARDPLSTAWIASFVGTMQVSHSEATTVIARDPLEDWRVVGLIQGDEGVWVTVAGFGEVRTLSLGETLNGFELIEIDTGEAVFRRGDEEHRLRLRR